MPRLQRSKLLRLARLLAVAGLCLATPAVLDVIVDAAAWLAGTGCCTDDCDDTGSPCTQECDHCVRGSSPLTPPADLLPVVARFSWAAFAVTGPHACARSGHLDPPFRPPVG